MGKSFSQQNPFGIRRKAKGQELAPRSLRRKNRLLSSCQQKDLIKAKVIEEIKE